MKLRLIFAVLVHSAAALAQQPDIRLQLMTLYKLRQVTLRPLEHSLMRTCATCSWTPYEQALLVSAEGNTLKSDRTPTRKTVLSFKDGVRLESAVAPARTVLTPVEVRASNGQLILITDLPMEDYIAQVVQGETSGNFPPDALRAMAVAARTYATHFRQRHKVQEFDYCDTTHCQFAQQNITPMVATVVQQTRGEILWRNGAAIAAYYHKDCGGHTESPAEVWPGSPIQSSASLVDSYCTRTSKPWRSELPISKVNDALKSAGLSVPSGWDHVSVADRTSSGRARTLLFGVGNSQSGVPVAASSIRFAIGRAYGWAALKSDWYEVSMQGDRVVFSGRGTGHGVGLCQLGAAEMARQGKNYREILAFYYPDAILSVAAAGIEWRKSSQPTFDVYTVAPASGLQDIAARALAWAKSQTRFRSPRRPAVYEYPTVQLFRDATGEPGWVAASTKGAQVRMQPVVVLGTRTEAVLRHEFVHFLVESNAGPGTPLWFREGLAILITGDDYPRSAATLSLSEVDALLRTRSDRTRTEAAYRAAFDAVARLDRRYGREKLLSWLLRGLPTVVTAELSSHKLPDQR